MSHFDILEFESELAYPSPIKDISFSPDFQPSACSVVGDSPRVFLSGTLRSNSPAFSKSISPAISNPFLNARTLTVSSPLEPHSSPSSLTDNLASQVTRLPPLFSTDFSKSCSEFPSDPDHIPLSPSASNTQPSNSLGQFLESPVVRRSRGDVTPPYQTRMSQSRHRKKNHFHQHTPVRRTTTTTTTTPARQRPSMPMTRQSSNDTADDHQAPETVLAQVASDTVTPFIDRLRHTTGKLVPASFSPTRPSSYSFSFAQSVPLASPFSGDTCVEHRSPSDGQSIGYNEIGRFLFRGKTPPSKPFMDFWNSPLTDSESSSSSRSPSVSPSETHRREDFESIESQPQELGPDTTCAAVLKTIKRSLSTDDTSIVLQQPKKRKLNPVNVNNKPSSMTSLESEANHESILQPHFDINTFRRTFPPDIPIREEFPALYRQYPIIPFFYPNGCMTSVLATRTTKRPPVSMSNEPRSAYDLYTPRFVKGVGINKVGLCPLCFEPKYRGGNGTIEWLAMKVSAYKCYHLQYVHGISSFTGAPFSPPTAFRISRRRSVEVRKHEKTELLHGKCHKCEKWVAVEGVKLGEVKVKELYWWKHAASCHKSTTIPGEGDIYIHDNVYNKLMDYEKSLANQSLRS